MTHGQPPSQRAKQVYAGAAKAIGSALDSAGLLPRRPPEARWAHWLVSLVRVHDSMAMVDLGVPWWTYRAIDAADAWLKARTGPVRVFEYGSGASTLWLAARASEVHTVEHHAGFFDHMHPAFARAGNVVPHLVEPTPSAAPRAPSAKAGYAGLDFDDYVRTIDRVGGTFDLVVVDGRARAAALQAALPHLAPDGLVVFDNSRRRRYRPAIEGSGLRESRHTGLTPTLPYPEQTSLLRR